MTDRNITIEVQAVSSGFEVVVAMPPMEQVRLHATTADDAFNLANDVRFIVRAALRRQLGIAPLPECPLCHTERVVTKPARSASDCAKVECLECKTIVHKHCRACIEASQNGGALPCKAPELIHKHCRACAGKVLSGETPFCADSRYGCEQCEEVAAYQAVETAHKS